MDEQNRYPDESSSASGPRPEGEYGDGPRGYPGDTPAPYAGTEHTRPLPPYQGGDPARGGPGGQGPAGGPFYAGPPPSSGRRGRGATAGILVAALVLGGAAGVGGAAAYHAFNDDSTSTSSTSSSGEFQTTKNAVVKDGTVEKVANAVLPSVVKVNVRSEAGAGSGSGIVLSKDGEILTNNHVVAGTGANGAISVAFNDGTVKKATVVGTDPLTDIAVIKVDGAGDLTPASLGKSGSLAVGQTVVAVGSPFGLNATVTSGIVSALHRPVSVAAEQERPQSPFGGEQPQQKQSLSTTYPAIQTDAAINPGNSGGPLVDMSGRVVGINSSIRTSSSSASGNPGGSIGLGFAIPIDEVLPIVNQITDGQQPTHARLAVTVSDVAGESMTQGAQLRSVESGGAGAKAGLKNGDIITKVGDQVIEGSESLVATVRGHRPGDKVEITYVRGGKTGTTTTVLGSDENTTTS